MNETIVDDVFKPCAHGSCMRQQAKGNRCEEHVSSDDIHAMATVHLYVDDMPIPYTAVTYRDLFEAFRVVQATLHIVSGGKRRLRVYKIVRRPVLEVVPGLRPQKEYHEVVL